MTFGSYHLAYDESEHAAHYGARLLYDEVKDGLSGVVYDRQTGSGDKELVEQRIFPSYDEFMDLVREEMSRHYGWSSSRDFVSAQFGDDVVFVASPQGSYGYIYLSAAVLRPTGVRDGINFGALADEALSKGLDYGREEFRKR